MMKKVGIGFLGLILLALLFQAVNAVASGFEFLSSIQEGGARDVEISDNRAYVLYSSGLLILDFSNPADPVLLGKHFFPDAPEDLRLMGDHAVVADSSAGVYIIDIRDPAHPIEAGVYNTNVDARGLDLQGDTLYVANGSYGLLVLALDDPRAPVYVTELGEYAPHNSVDVEGDYAYLASGQNGLDVIRISDLPNLQHVARLNEHPLLVQSRDVRVSLDHAYIADVLGLATVDVSDPGNPVLIDPYLVTPGRALDLFIDLPFLYLADDVAGFHIFEVETNPGVPNWQSQYDTGDDARGIAADGGIAVVADDFGAADDWAGALFVNILDPVNPELLGTFPSGGECQGGLLAGDLAYVGQGNQGIIIVNIEDPRIPSIVTAFTDSIGFVNSMALRDTVLAVANRWRGLLIVDVSDPSSPAYMGEVDTGREVTRVGISSEMAYVVDGDFRAVDLSDPSSPAVVSSYDTESFSVDLSLNGDLAFVADSDNGLLSFDVSNPRDTLLMLDRFDSPGNARGVDATEDVTGLADGPGGLRLLGYDSGGQMDTLGHLDLGDDAVDVVIENGIAFVTLERGEVVAVDVGDPRHPTVIDNFPTPGRSESVDASSSLVLVSDGSSAIFLGYSPSGVRGDGGTVTQLIPVGSTILSQNRPNPFNPSTSIEFRVPGSRMSPGNGTEVRLDIFSLRGRWVRELYSDRARAGEHVVLWDGTNADGCSVPSGVYIYVLKMGEIRVARKMLLVR
jgi:hypothetical protein